MEFRILGPVEVLDAAGVRFDVGGAPERALLALLALNANQVVPTERLIDGVWGDRRTDGAAHALRVHVSRLRRALRAAGRDDVLRTRPHGYLLAVKSDTVESDTVKPDTVEPDTVDVVRFESLLAAGRRLAASGDHAGAAETLREALAQWRGPALADVVDAPFARAQAARLDEVRLAAVEQRIDQDLACGRHTELVGELGQLTATHPLRERLWAARMLALYRSGRQVDALAAYRELHALLRDQFALEPSAELARLHGAILRREAHLDGRPPRPSPSRPTRTRYARSGPVNIAYQVVGDGPVDVVVVPGFVSNVDGYWDNPGWVRVFDRLAAHRRLILWDKRGTGLSDPVHRVPTLTERVDDLLAVLDAAGSHRATLLGISEGGPMSLLFAATHPERVDTLVLYGGTPRFSRAPGWPWGWSPATVTAVLAEIDREWGDGALLGMFAPTYAGDEPARLAWARSQRAGASPAMARAVMEAMVAIDCRQILPAIRVPTLLLHRRGDRVAPLPAARYLAEHVPGARLVEFPGENHLLPLGSLDPILDEIDAFLAGRVPSAP